MPHDMTVSAAMLLVATLNITLGLLPSFRQDHSTPSQLVHRIQRYWLSFSPFARLSLCHALLAKLPIVVVTNVELEEQPLLVALFQHITTLSNRYSRHTYVHTVLTSGYGFKYLSFRVVCLNPVQDTLPHEHWHCGQALQGEVSNTPFMYLTGSNLCPPPLLPHAHRECVCGTEAGSPLSLSLAPSGPIMQTLLQYIWSLWEDPIDVSCWYTHCTY